MLEWLCLVALLVALAITVPLVLTATSPSAIAADLAVMALKAVLKHLLPSVIAAFAPKDFTPEQREKIRRGEDPFDQHSKHGGKK